MNNSRSGKFLTNSKAGSSYLPNLAYYFLLYIVIIAPDARDQFSASKLMLHGPHVLVVYFNQCLGACWSKYAFLTFLTAESYKKRKKQEICIKI